METEMALTHAAPGEKIALTPLNSLPANSKTSALVKTDRFEVVRLVLRAGSEIPAHSVNGFITLHCLEGAINLQARSTVRLNSGDWVYLDRGEQHSLSAFADSSVLLTIFFD
jgi:quercetin dioxygenase-like cupin family protein